MTTSTKPRKIWKTVHPISKIKTRPSNLKQKILAKTAASTKASAGKARVAGKDSARRSSKAASQGTEATRWTQSKYSCKHCSMSFDNPRALGGHFSKQHKGLSDAYNKKMEVRESRTIYRDALHLAKELVQRHGRADAKFQRSNLTHLRNVIISSRESDLKNPNPRE